MKFLTLGITGACLACVLHHFLQQQAHAAIVYSIDADPNAIGIQSTRAVSPNSTFTVDLVASLPGAADSVSSYGVSVQFDTTELNLSSVTELAPSTDVNGNALSGSLSNFTSGVSGTSESIGNGLGEIRTFEAGTFGSGPVGPSLFVVGSISFTAANPGGDASDIDILPGEFNSLIDMSFDNSVPGQRIVPTFVGASVTVIPEPTCVGLLFCVGSALLLVRSKRCHGRIAGNLRPERPPRSPCD